MLLWAVVSALTERKESAFIDYQPKFTIVLKVLYTTEASDSGGIEIEL